MSARCLHSCVAHRPSHHTHGDTEDQSFSQQDETQERLRADRSPRALPARGAVAARGRAPARFVVPTRRGPPIARAARGFLRHRRDLVRVHPRRPRQGRRNATRDRRGSRRGHTDLGRDAQPGGTAASAAAAREACARRRAHGAQRQGRPHRCAQLQLLRVPPTRRPDRVATELPPFVAQRRRSGARCLWRRARASAVPRAV